MAGYSGTPLAKKLGIKEDFSVGLVGAPKGFRTELGELPASVAIETQRLKKPVDLILFFVKSESALQKQFGQLKEKLAINGMLWVAWPKKSSGVSTDLTFTNVQRIGLDAGLVDVKICAVNEIWSGLKFVYRLKDRKPKNAERSH